jgi:ABC-2 type transport system permease protein
MEVCIKFENLYQQQIEMDIIKLSTDWARAEIFSAKIIWLFSFTEIIAAIGFWLWGKTVMAKFFVWPLLVAGIFLVATGAGLYLTNHPRIAKFQTEYNRNPESFLQGEIQRTGNSKRQLALLFKILPAIIIVAAAGILVSSPSLWRAIAITTIITAAFLMVVDSNTEARNNIYNSQLSSFKQ